MSSIMIKPQRVQDEAGDIAAYAVRLQSAAQRLNQLLHSISPEIMARRSLLPRMQAAVRQLNDIEAQLRMLQSFLRTSAVRYEQVEDRLLRESERMRTGGALVPPFSPEGSTHSSRPEWRPGDGMPGFPTTGDAPWNTPASEQRSDLLEHVSGAASYFNSILSKSSNAVVATGLVATLSALASTANLHIQYIGGKPTLLQKIKGNYKFTVSADASWTSKSKYSSSIARGLYNFSKSTSSNRLLGMLQQHVASYRGPAAIAKHLAGFAKNTNAAMYGSTLFSVSTQRSSRGALGLLGSAASSKGWTAGSRWIPYAGTVVSIVTHSVQEVKSPGRTPGEIAGRVLAATATDVGAMWVGAKVGAAIGSVGGPVGIIVGGAVGALVGGIASSQFGDEIKAVGGKIGSAIEKGAKTGITALNRTFKSVGAWFT